MRKRTTIEVDPIILKGIKQKAGQHHLKVKEVSDSLLRASLPWADRILADALLLTNNRDNGR